MKIIRLVMIIACLSVSVRGADLANLLHDTQKLAQDPSNFTLVWWIPTEYWDVSLRNNPQVTDEARARLDRVLSGYLVFAVTSADIGPMGGMTPKDHDAINTNTELLINGKIIVPLKNDDISIDALNFISVMKPMMANMLGRFGQGLEFLIYPNPPEGSQKVSVTKSGRISYIAFGHRFEWNLPLGSFLPPKLDPKTKQVFPGDYIYNPYTGDKLTMDLAQPDRITNGAAQEH